MDENTPVQLPSGGPDESPPPEPPPEPPRPTYARRPEAPQAAQAPQHDYVQPPPTPQPPPATQPTPPVTTPAPAKPERDRGRRTLGMILIVIGILFLFDRFIDWDVFWPIVLIALGLVIWFRR